MSGNYTIMWVGHNCDGHHDKIWGWLKINDGRHFAFWGRRGKKLRFKEHLDWRTLHDLRFDKEFKKGYYRVLPHEYDTLVKDFLSEVEIWCTTAILEDNVM